MKYEETIFKRQKDTAESFKEEKSFREYNTHKSRETKGNMNKEPFFSK